MVIQVLHKKFTVSQYHQMIESGILTDRDRVELIKGEILEMSPVGKQHAACVDRLTELFILALSTDVLVRNQNPIRLSNHSEPQPDLVLLNRKDDYYATGHPESTDVLALIEVSDTTIDFDRSVKLPLYAQDGIPEVWIIDLNAQAVEASLLTRLGFKSQAHSESPQLVDSQTLDSPRKEDLSNEPGTLVLSGGMPEPSDDWVRPVLMFLY